MNIPDEAVKKGYITIYLDTDREIVSAVDEYNDHLGKCRIKMKYIQEIEFGYMILNPLIILCLIVASPENIFRDSVAIPIILLLVYAAVYVAFALVKKNYIISTIFMALLIFLDIKFGIVLAADIILTILHKKFSEPLKAEPGYPNFADIRITYERRNSPGND